MDKEWLELDIVICWLVGLREGDIHGPRSALLDDINYVIKQSLGLRPTTHSTEHGKPTQTPTNILMATSLFHPLHLPLSPLRCRRWPLRTFAPRTNFTTSATRLHPRVPIGRIEPKRVVVDISDVRASIWKPILVRLLLMFCRFAHAGQGRLT